MGKDPAFLFYPNDFHGGTMGMTFEDKGAYIDLLILQFNRGHMTSDMIGHTVGQLFGRIQSKFKIDSNGLYYNERLDIEIEKRKNYIESRKNNLTGINQYTNKSGHMGGHMTDDMAGHMENENRDIDISNVSINNELIVKPKKPSEKQVNTFYETIWKLYPKKEGKGAVKYPQKEILFNLGVDVITKCIARYLDAKKDTDEQFLKMGSTFFNSGYIDYLDENYVEQQIVDNGKGGMKIC